MMLTKKVDLGAKCAVESVSKVHADLTEKMPIRVLHIDDEASFLGAPPDDLEGTKGGNSLQCS